MDFINTVNFNLTHKNTVNVISLYIIYRSNTSNKFPKTHAERLENEKKMQI